MQREGEGKHAERTTLLLSVLATKSVFFFRLSKRRTLAFVLAAVLVAVIIIICVLTLTGSSVEDLAYTNMAIAVDVPPCADFGL